MTRSVMIEAMKNGALGADAVLVANKATVGLYYADAGLQDTDFSLASVTAYQSSVEAAIAEVDNIVENGNTCETFSLTTGIDGLDKFTGTTGNDTYTATVNDTTGATNATWTSLDSLDGAAGNDVLNLNILTANSDATSMLNIAKGTLANIETINIQAVESIDGSATDDTTAVDFSNVSGLTTLNTTKSTTVVLKAAATTDVNVSGAAGAVVVDGGKNVSVTDATGNANITIGDTTESAGTVTVTDTKQGTGNIVVEGGTDATVTATTTVTTAAVTAGTINVGNNTDAPTGAIKVTQNNVSNGSDANASAATVAEKQTLTFTGTTQTDGNITIGGITIAVLAVDNAAVTAGKVAAALNGQTLTAPASTGAVTAAVSGDVVTVTFPTTAGDVALITVANGTSTLTGAPTPVETVKGAIAGALDEDLTAGAINVKGGTSIDITVNSTNTATAVEGDGDIINGTVTATAGDATTSMSVVQNNTATTFTKAAVATVNEKSTVTFGAMLSGETLIVNGLTFKASKDLTAEQVASAFANLTAADTQSAGGSTANGIYTGTFNTAVWTSAAASGATVVFTAQDEDETNLVFTGTGVTVDATRAPKQVDVAGTAAVAADTTSNTVTAGNVVLNDNTTASVTDITVENFGTATLGTTDGFDKLANLTLINNTGAITLDTAATALTINANDVVSTITIDSGAATVTNLTINATGKASDTDLTAAAVETLTVTGDQSVTLTGSTLTKLKTVTVSGTAGLILGAANEADTITSVNTTATTGAVTIAIDGNVATYTGGAGVDTVTLATTAALTKAIDLGAGNDTVIFDAEVTGSTATLSGGDGTDTLSMDTANAAALDGTTQSFYTSFERLTINDAGATSDIDLAQLGFTNYVTTTGSAGTLTLSNLASNGTVVLTAAPTTGTTIKVKDAATGTADIVNVVAQVSTADIDFKALTIANVETINLTATDTNVDEDADGITYETGDRDEAAVALTADKATTVNISGNASIELTMTAANVTKVDATSLEGVLTYDTDNASMTVIGGNGADAITASKNGVTINGGAGNDTITIGEAGAGVANIDSVKLDGGAGADTFKFLDVATTDSIYAVISNIGSGDVIDLTSLDVSNIATAVTTFNNQKITLSLGASESTQAYQDAAMGSLATNGAGWFQFGGNTFIVADMDGNATYTDGVDFTVMLVGNVDLSTASFNTAGLIEIA